MDDMAVIAVREACGGIHGVCVDSVEHIKETADFVAGFGRGKDKYEFKRVTVEEFRSGPPMCFCKRKKGA